MVRRTVYFLLFVPPILFVGCAGSQRITRGPYLADGTTTSMTAVWWSASPGIGRVDYGLTPLTNESVTEGNAGLMHVVRIDGLSPDMRYYYHVKTDSDSGRLASFMTAPSPGTPFSFIIYGDTRSNNAAHRAVLARMPGTSPRFVVNTGDLVASNTVENWNAFFADLCDSTGVGSIAPYYASPGNHENGAMYFDNVVLPANNAQHSSSYYSFDYGDVHLISLNTEIDYSPTSPQQQWLRGDLASAAAHNAKFRIAYWHRPPYSTGHHGSDLNIRALLCSPVEAGLVDLVLTGHDHDYERTVPIHGTTYVVSGGGGAPLYDAVADSAWTAYKEKSTHFCLFRVDGNSLTMKMVRASDGTVRDSLTVHSRTPSKQDPGAQ